MQKWIKYSLITLGITIFVEIQVGMAFLSPQHKDFLELFFWKFPKAIWQSIF